jgi:hypothetical protein
LVVFLALKFHDEWEGQADACLDSLLIFNFRVLGHEDLLEKGNDERRPDGDEVVNEENVEFVLLRSWHDAPRG